MPDTLPYKDAIFSSSRACLVTAALITGDLDQLTTAMQDRLHHPYRAQLIPGFDQILTAAVKAGALGAALSGAGPTLLALTAHNADDIGQAMIEIWQKKNICARYEILDIDPHGVTFI